MYVIAVYDMNEKRVAKMLKICRKYLNWIQNSVFEGELTPATLEAFKMEAKALIKEEEDSLIIFTSRQEEWLDKQIVGKEKMNIDSFL